MRARGHGRCVAGRTDRTRPLRQSAQEAEDRLRSKGHSSDLEIRVESRSLLCLTTTTPAVTPLLCRLNVRHKWRMEYPTEGPHSTGGAYGVARWIRPGAGGSGRTSSG